MKIFIDTSIIIHAFTNSERAVTCRKLLQDGGTINGLILIESFECIKRITKDTDYALQVIRSLHKSNLEIVNITNGFIFDALKRSDKYDLKVFDLIHYVTALLSGCSTIASYDKDFDNLEIKRIEP
jgi:predicted nucleic acid-binding protein